MLCSHKGDVMIQTNVREAKAKLSSYLSQVEQGEEVMIVRRGKPVAILKAVEQTAHLPSMKAFREKMRVKVPSASETIIRMREESRY
ncbi:MAG: type II toxin-antitoxin system prevent-host-death family antitoxin [Thermodesulfobacteriota bacterium]|nr:MAG: type II toxin-antitoxin system prevent-host-death family antitoxin [Thermodesulfobacteriota bacterium]